MDYSKHTPHRVRVQIDRSISTSFIYLGNPIEVENSEVEFSIDFPSSDDNFVKTAIKALLDIVENNNIKSISIA